MILEKLFRGNKKVIGNVRILVLMLLVAVAVYHLTAQDICNDLNNTKLTNKDKLGFFYKCDYLNDTELEIIYNSKNYIKPNKLYNFSVKYIN